MSYRQVLCVGGRHDGLRLRVDEQQRLVNVSDIPELPLVSRSPVEVSGLSCEVYLIECIGAAHRKFWVGRPPDQSMESTVALLIQGYRGV